MLQNQLPSCYTHLLPAEILEAPLLENRVDCSNCSKAQPGESKPFRADLKCCTYHPFLANFVVGEILSDPARISTSALEVLEGKILRREYALPLGLVAPLSFQIPFHQRIPADFGNREDWLCPYYDKDHQNCGIWLYRNSTCITYFCKSSYAQAGQNFWIALKSYLLFLEVGLAAHCARTLGFDEESILTQKSFLFRRDGTLYERHIPELPVERSQALWDKHYDTQKEFFMNCAALIKKLDPKQADLLLGEDGQSKKSLCLQALNQLSFAT